VQFNQRKGFIMAQFIPPKGRNPASHRAVQNLVSDDPPHKREPINILDLARTDGTNELKFPLFEKKYSNLLANLPEREIVALEQSPTRFDISKLTINKVHLEHFKLVDPPNIRANALKTKIYQGPRFS